MLPRTVVIRHFINPGRCSFVALPWARLYCHSVAKPRVIIAPLFSPPFSFLRFSFRPVTLSPHLFVVPSSSRPVVQSKSSLSVSPSSPRPVLPSSRPPLVQSSPRPVVQSSRRPVIPSPRHSSPSSRTQVSPSKIIQESSPESCKALPKRKSSCTR